MSRVEAGTKNPEVAGVVKPSLVESFLGEAKKIDDELQISTNLNLITDDDVTILRLNITRCLIEYQLHDISTKSTKPRKLKDILVSFAKNSKSDTTQYEEYREARLVVHDQTNERIRKSYAPDNDQPNKIRFAVNEYFRPGFNPTSIKVTHSEESAYRKMWFSKWNNILKSHSERDLS